MASGIVNVACPLAVLPISVLVAATIICAGAGVTAPKKGEEKRQCDSPIALKVLRALYSDF